MRYYLITNNPRVAESSQEAGVDSIFVDLEYIGKAKRQAGRDTVLSRHTLDDVRRIRQVVSRAELLVRVNPMHAKSVGEVNNVIDAGADAIMLPYFKTAAEVHEFVGLVAGRARIVLLLETSEAVRELTQIVSAAEGAEVHIGLNDLHLSFGLRSMFEPLINGTVDSITATLRDKNFRFGIGGVGRLGYGVVPPALVLSEYLRQGASATILSRSFVSAADQASPNFADLVSVRLAELRRLEERLGALSPRELLLRREQLVQHVEVHATAQA